MTPRRSTGPRPKPSGPLYSPERMVPHVSLESTLQNGTLSVWRCQLPLLNPIGLTHLKVRTDRGRTESYRDLSAPESNRSQVPPYPIQLFLREPFLLVDVGTEPMCLSTGFMHIPSILSPAKESFPCLLISEILFQ